MKIEKRNLQRDQDNEQQDLINSEQVNEIGQKVRDQSRSTKESVLQLIDKSKLLIKQWISKLCEQKNMEKMIRIIFIIYFIIPILQILMLINLLLHTNNKLGLMAFFFLFLASKKVRFQRFMPTRLNSMNPYLKNILVVFDIDHLYQLIKFPQYCEEFIIQRTRYQTEQNTFYYQLQFFNTFNQFQNEEICMPYFNLIMILLSASFGLAILRYHEYYKRNPQDKYESYLLSYKFGIINFHTVVFLAQIGLIFEKSSLLVIGYFIFHALSYLSYVMFYKVSEMQFHVPIDISYDSVQDFTNQQLLKLGYQSFNKGYQLWVIQKIVLIILSIFNFTSRINVNPQFDNGFIYFLYFLVVICLSVKSFLDLLKNYQKQNEALYGSNRQIIEIKTEQDLENLVNQYQQDRKQFEKIKFLYYFNNNQPQISLIVKCLFQSFDGSLILFQGLQYYRFTIKQFKENYYNKSIRIAQVSDLSHLDNPKDICKDIYEVYVSQQSQNYNNSEVYEELFNKGINLMISNENLRNPFYLNYILYQCALKSTILQIIAFKINLTDQILNNPQQVFYDMYD